MTQYGDEDYKFDEEDQNDSPLMKQLRKQLKDLKKERDEAKTALEKESEKLSNYQIRDVLKDKGISDARAAKYLKADNIDLANEADVEKWLDENGDMFGYQKPAAPEKEQEVAEAFGQMQATESLGQPNGRQHEIIAALENTKNPEDVLSLIMTKYGNVRVSE